MTAAPPKLGMKSFVAEIPLSEAIVWPIEFFLPFSFLVCADV